ncbi:MAG: DUF6544 family protein [Acidobacteriota bacterium]|nr:DUF6544 family protein [Acidobacteriota bacterium]
MSVLLALVIALGAVLLMGTGILWVGFQTLAPEFPPPEESGRGLGRQPLPEGLPQPVDRFFRQIFGGDQVPVMETALVWGRGRFRLGPLWIPMRFRAAYRLGDSFHRLLELTWFGRPVMKGKDRYVNGHGELRVRGWATQDFAGPEVDRAQHLTLWAESVWAPAAWALDPRVRWEAGDDEHSARLTLPWQDEGDELMAHFDAKTGLLQRLTGLRHRGTDPQRKRWEVQLKGWQSFGSWQPEVQIPAVGLVRWRDQLSPYGVFHVEGVETNLDVSAYLPEEGAVEGEEAVGSVEDEDE